MDDSPAVNSAPYWNGRFDLDWESNLGPLQSRFFAQLAIDHLPAWFATEIRRHGLRVADWGCAQGDGTDLLASHLGAANLTGVDFSDVAVGQARARYPGLRFVADDWLGDGDKGDRFDIVFSSNTLEHFHSPYEVLDVLCRRARLAVALALPYREMHRIDEHFYSFLPANLPLVLANGFKLCWSVVVDCAPLPGTHWSGEQVFLVYAEPQWLDQLGLRLAECRIEQEDYRGLLLRRDKALADQALQHAERADALRSQLDAERHDKERCLAELQSRLVQQTAATAAAESALRSARLQAAQQMIRSKELQVRAASLQAAVQESEHALTDCRVALAQREAELDRAVVESRMQAGELAGAVARASALEQGLQMAQAEVRDLRASTSWRLTRPLRAAGRLVRAATDPQARYALAKSVYWRLPESIRHRLQGRRHAYVAKHLLAQQAQAPAASPANAQEPWLVAARAARHIMVIPCGFEFDELVNQRPINAAKHFAALGYLVLFVPWQWSPDEGMKKGCAPVWQGVFQVPLYTFLAGASQLPRTPDPSFFLLTMPAAPLARQVPLLRSLGFGIVYDIMDEWEEFARVGQAPWFDRAEEDALVLQADCVTAVSPALADKFSGLRSDIVICGNGYTPDVIGVGSRGVAANAGLSPVVIGYFGHLTDAWFDWNAVLSVARARKDWTFEIIGYGEPEWVRRAVDGMDNMHLLGKVLPRDLHLHAARWRVAMIPFVEGALAEAVDPIKIYEYLYFGLRTVVTGIRHLSAYPQTVVAEREGLEQAISRSLELQPVADALDAFLASTTWAARFDALHRHLLDTPRMRVLYAE